ncbi:MAG TPA: SDR family NAD(P)-dependent oxidoreductase [Candidatus Margulisiibacteriota bacterium]|nr:SDR family NAD(P)-dependent oxidoreductase [Candidatus Margulisiibacteriota bacterium]
MTCSIEGKVAIVTGAAGGLGRAYAVALAQVGAAVVVNDIGTAVGSAGAVVEEIRAQGGRALGIVESVADAGGVRRLVAETLGAFGRLDILVNNAGIVRSRPIVEMSDDDFDAVLAVHLRGTFLCIREALRVMRTRGSGRVINTTSGRAYSGHSAGTANYAAAKGGIISLTGVTAVEGKEYGITCNAISPLARTPMSEQFLAGDSDPNLDPAAVAPLVVFLASDAAAAITGEVFRVARGEISVVRTAIGAPVRTRNTQWTPEEIAQRIGEIRAATVAR